ncbi:GNAT domain-domain-containing protein [Kockovaella imperatae]|uniref:N-acetyltransferase 9-like protein n=1 Tax=Kockovaella imperatae TaxID=4999 RepID=A0A1Y1UVP4_9TREE|nr:GNAT domain-domain-containing protein [Kockovaella imperatae]ORX41305.1 GNAT domain-domain-containing protein [Kockovaella imperatae]
MRVNENTVICGDKVVLVPYRREHVETYHEWMKSPELLELTASEPLSLEEEYEMQRKWHMDEDSTPSVIQQGSSSPKIILEPSELRQCSMVGDVNLFLPDGLGGDVECEIMIATKEDRRKGYAREALTLFLSYAISTLKIQPHQLIARIGMDNEPSIRLFESMGFGIEKRVEVFREVGLRWGHKPSQEGEETQSEVSDEKADWLADLEGMIGPYDE